MKPPNAFSDFRFERAVLEVRYPKAHKYWDDCGKCIEAIEARLPGVTCEKLDDQGFRFVGQDGSGVSSALFFWDKVVVAQESDVPFSRFSPAAATFWRVVGQALDVVTTTRVGHRVWHSLPASDLRAAERWLDELDLWRPATTLLGRPVNSGVVLRTFLDSEKKSVRIDTAPATMQKGGSTRFGVLVDVDFVLAAAPSRAIFDPEEFMKTNVKLLESTLLSIFGGRG